MSKKSPKLFLFLSVKYLAYQMVSRLIILDVLTNLGMLDVHLGLISIFASIRKLSNLQEVDLDFKEFMMNLKKYMVLEEAYCNKDGESPVITVSNLNKPDYLLFENNIPANIFRNDYLGDVFDPLVAEGDLVCYNTFTTGCHKIERNTSLLKRHSMHEKLIALLHSRKEFKQKFLPIERIGVNFDKLQTRLSLSAKLINRILDENLVETSGNKNNVECQNTINIPVVGTVRNSSAYSASLYILSHFGFATEVRLGDIAPFIQNVIMDSFVIDRDQYDVLVKAYDLDAADKKGTPRFFSKVFCTRPKDAHNDAYALCQITFNLNSQRIGAEIMKKAKEYVLSELGWNVWFPNGFRSAEMKFLGRQI